MNFKLLFYWSFFSGFLFANTLKVGVEESYQVQENILYTLAEDLNEIPAKLEKRVWTKDKESFNSWKDIDKAYWAKIEIENISNEKKEYYFQAENQFTYAITFYLVKNNLLIDVIEDGVIHKNKNRAFNANHMMFPLILEANEKATVFFKIRNYNKIDIRFHLRSKEYLLEFYQTYNFVEGIFFGGMLIMMIYNLFLYFLLHFRSYIYYVFYTFWLIVYFIGLFGFSQRYFEGYIWMFYMSSGAFFVALTLFIQSILNLKEKLPFINKILNFFIFYFTITTVINSFILENHLFVIANILFNFFFLMVLFYAGLIVFSTYYLAYSKRDVVAQFYAFIWTIVSIIGVTVPLVYLNIAEFSIHSDYVFQFIMLFEVLCFSFVLAYKIKVIQKEKESQELLLVQQSKLASMGEMISTIAHQWRQPLSEINGIVLEIDVDSRKDILNQTTLDKHLNEIEGVTAYLSGTIHDFMNFFKHDKALNSFSMGDAIKRMENLLLLSYKKTNIDIQYNIDSSTELYSYQSELIQALLIVMNNSIDAVLSQNRVNPKIILTSILMDKKMVINVEDNGGGIPLEIMDKVYNPYFTTKHKFEGTGLGLYILKMLVEQSLHGSVYLKNKKDGLLCQLVIPLTIIKKK